MSKENASELRQIADGAARHVHALKALKCPTDVWGDLLVYILSSKLNTATAREWQSSLEGIELSTLKQFFYFLSHRWRVLESTDKSGNVGTKSVYLRNHSNAKQKASCNTP